MTTVTFNQQPITLSGHQLSVGDKAPQFSVLSTDLQEVTLAQTSGKIRLISVVPSIDTGVCSEQTKKFNEAAKAFGDNVEVLTISVDLPFAQARWAKAAGIDQRQFFSDHREVSFGEAFGVLIKELRLLTRAIFVIDQADTVRYVEYVQEVTDHPDYDQALDAVQQVANH